MVARFERPPPQGLPEHGDPAKEAEGAAAVGVAGDAAGGLLKGHPVGAAQGQQPGGGLLVGGAVGGQLNGQAGGGPGDPGHAPALGPGADKGHAGGHRADLAAGQQGQLQAYSR
jgi:hypothetical protein